MSLPQIAGEHRQALERAEAFLFDCIKPKAQEIDLDVGALRAALDSMAERGLLGLRVPKEYGGMGFDDSAFRRFQETCARCSGTLAFLQTQHQSACNFIVKSDNAALKEAMLPKLTTGERKAGIAFSQLRRHGAPMLTAAPERDGFVLQGKAPWLTGWGIFDSCVTAATLPDGDTIFVYHDLNVPMLHVSEPMRLAAMEVAQTVSAQFTGLHVPQEKVLYTKPGNWIDENDMVNIALQSPFALGCAQAGIDVMRTAYEKKQLEAIRSAADKLQEELDRCREEVYSAMESAKREEEQQVQRSLSARAWAIELAGKCAHAAIAASSGAGNSINHPAQRVYREALVFTVSAQTAPIMKATLERLASRQ